MAEYSLQPEDHVPDARRRPGLMEMSTEDGTGGSPRSPGKRKIPAFPWYRSNMVLATLPAILIVAFNVWLVWASRGNFLMAVGAVIVVPFFNLILLAVLLACAPVVRAITGWSAKLHVAVTFVGILLAVVVDISVICGYLG